jgi:hypothetical protein
VTSTANRLLRPTAAVELLSAHLNLTAERLEAVAATAEPNVSA